VKQAVFDRLTEQLPIQADFIQAEANAGESGFAKLAACDVPGNVRQDRTVLIEQRDALCR
jgi:hypothetical protein